MILPITKDDARIYSIGYQQTTPPSGEYCYQQTTPPSGDNCLVEEVTGTAVLSMMLLAQQ